MKNDFHYKKYIPTAGSAILLALIAISVFFFCLYAVRVGDDAAYRYIYTLDGISDNRISSFADILKSQAAHYFTWNGRFFAHTLVQFFCGIATVFSFGILNGLMWIVFIGITCRLCGIPRFSLKYVLPVAAMLMLALPTKMTPSCQIGYVWMYVLTGWFLLLFFKENARSSFGLNALLFIFSLLAGNGQESINIPVGGALAVWFLFNVRKMTPRQWAMLVGFAIGALLLCLAPANFHRVSTNKVSLAGSLYYFIILDYFLWILLGVTSWNMLVCKRKLRDIYSESSFFWNALAVGIVFNLLIGVFLTRQVYGIQFFSVILIIRQFPKRTINRYVSTFLALLLIAFTAYQAYIVGSVRHQWNEIVGKMKVSDSGLIFADTYFDTTSLSFYDYCEGLHQSLLTYANENYHFLQLALLEDAPGAKPPIIMPEVLKGKLDKRLKTQIIEYKPKCYLVIVQDNSKVRPIFDREFDIPLLHIKLDRLDASRLKPAIRGNGWSGIVFREPELMIGVRFCGRRIEPTE